MKTGNIQMDGDAKVHGALAVDGKVTVEGDLVVKGVVVKKSDMQISDNMILLNHYEGDDPQPLTESGLEVYRGDDDKARIIWDEESKKWRMGTGNQLEDIAGGSKWNTLIGEDNADALHMHSQVYNENGDILALSASAAGNVDIPHILTVGSNMTVIGNLDVKGKVTSINTEKLEIRDNIITVNRYQHEGASQSDGGIEVYRGEKPAASIIWDETNELWKMGKSGENPALKVDSNGNITASGKLNSVGANIEGALQVKNGMEILRNPEQKAKVAWNEETKQWSIGVENNACLEVSESGKVTVGAGLDVKENAAVKGKVTADSAEVKSIIIDSEQDEKLTLKGSQRSLFISENGFEVSRKDSGGKDLPSAKIVWDEANTKWLFGYGEDLQDIKFNNSLYSSDGKILALSVSGSSSTSNIVNINVDANIKGSASIDGNANIKGSATIDGNTDIKGNATVKGTLTIKSGLEADKGSGQKGLLTWDEEKGTWKAGPTDKLQEISLSDHTHINFCSPDGTPAITVDTSGNATVSNNLTVNGELMVTGKTVTVKAETLEVSDNIIRINKYENQDEPLALNGGISVFRGGKEPEAQIIWNEKDLKWQAGTTDGLKDIGFREHYHNFICPETASLLH
jgi:cytoskeletal protein CcmA (bactofilin family)